MNKKIFSDSNDQIIFSYETQITIIAMIQAIQNKNKSIFITALTEYKWGVNSETEIVLLIQAFIFYVVLDQEYSLQVLTVEQDTWAEYVKKSKVITLDKGIEYLINRFFKSPSLAGKDDGVLDVERTFLSMFEIIEKIKIPFLNDLSNKKIINEFKNNIAKYAEDARKKQNTVNLSTLNFLKTPNQTITEQVKGFIKNNIRDHIQKCPEFNNGSILEITLQVTAYVTINLYTCQEIDNEKYQNELLYEYKKFELNPFQKFNHNFPKNSSEFLNISARYLVNIFIRSFILVDLETANSITKNIKNSMAELSKEFSNSIIISKLNSLVIEMIDGFSARYESIHSFNSKNNTQLFNKMKIEELISFETIILKYFGDPIIKPCTHIMIPLLDQIASINHHLYLRTKKDTHKEKMINAYRASKAILEGFYPNYFILCNTDIHLHDVDNEFNQYYLAMKKNISILNNSKKLKNEIQIIDLFFTNFANYISHIFFNEFKIAPSKYSYDLKKNLSENIKCFIDMRIKDITGKNDQPLSMIHCFQGIERVLKLNNLDISLITNIIQHKFLAIQALFSEYIADSAGKYFVHYTLFYQFGHQYVTDYFFLRKNLKEFSVEDQTLIAIFDFIIQAAILNLCQEKPDYYIKRALEIFPNHINFFRVNAEIEADLYVKRSSEIQTISRTTLKTIMTMSDNIDLELKNEISVIREPSNYNEEYETLKNVFNTFNKLKQQISKFYKSINSAIKQLDQIDIEIINILEFDYNYDEEDINIIKIYISKLNEFHNKYEQLIRLKTKIENDSCSCAELISQHKALFLRIREMIVQYELNNFQSKNEETIQITSETLGRPVSSENIKRIVKPKNKNFKNRKKLDKLDKWTMENTVPDNIDIPIETIADMKEASLDINETIISESSLENIPQIIVKPQEEPVFTDSSITIPTSLLFIHPQKPISKSLFDKLYELDSALQKIDESCYISLKGSFVTICFMFKINVDEKIINNFQVNDIDVCINLGNADFHQVENLLNQFNFVSTMRQTAGKSYRKYILEIDKINVDLTLITHSSIYVDGNFIPLSMGIMLFSSLKNQNERTETDTQEKIMIKVHNYLLEIITPVKYQEAYIEACALNKFPMVKLINEDEKHRIVCYRIYHNAKKLAACGMLPKFENPTIDDCSFIPSGNLFYYHQLFDEVSKYFHHHFKLKHACHNELKEFIDRGISPGTEPIAIFCLSAFYAGYILSIYPSPIERENLKEISTQCASTFTQEMKLLAQHPNIFKSRIYDIAHRILYSNKMLTFFQPRTIYYNPSIWGSIPSNSHQKPIQESPNKRR